VLDTVPEATASRSPANCSARAFLVSMLDPRCSVDPTECVCPQTKGADEGASAASHESRGRDRSPVGSLAPG
jgi:hypothetical protein